MTAGAARKVIERASRILWRDFRESDKKETVKKNSSPGGVADISQFWYDWVV